MISTRCCQCYRQQDHPYLQYIQRSELNTAGICAFGGWPTHPGHVCVRSIWCKWWILSSRSDNGQLLCLLSLRKVIRNCFQTIFDTKWNDHIRRRFYSFGINETKYEVFVLVCGEFNVKLFYSANRDCFTLRLMQMTAGKNTIQQNTNRGNWDSNPGFMQLPPPISAARLNSITSTTAT